ncbi:hypothetical protein KFE80_08865 [bacterium SCSIO 12696]|nr:hypothetical protein KFE80_08865 [bacterium SCSIO 12696]
MSKERPVAMSFKLAAVNASLGALGATLVVTFSWGGSGPIHPLLKAPFFYFCISCVPTLASLGMAVMEKIRHKAGRYINHGIALNLGYLATFIILVLTFLENFNP